MSDPPQEEIFLVLDHQSLQLTLEKSASLRNTGNKYLNDGTIYLKSGYHDEDGSRSMGAGESNGRKRKK